MVKMLLLLFLLSSLHLRAQVQGADLYTEKTKALYRSVENEVSIAVPGYRCDEIGLESPNCTVRGRGCNYIVVPKDAPVGVLLILSQKNKTIIDSILVPVRTIPNSVWIQIASGKENRGPILKDGPFLLSEEGPVAEALFRIVAFEVTLVRKDSIIHQCATKGSHFEPATITAFEQAQAGDRLLLEAIQVSGPDRQQRLMSVVTYTFR